MSKVMQENWEIWRDPYLHKPPDFSYILIVTKPCGIIAHIDPHNENPQLAEAQARLIVKAPDLVEALRFYVKLDNDHRSDCKLTKEDWSACHSLAMCALAGIEE